MNSDKVTKLFYSIIPMRFVRFHAYRVNKFIQKLSLEYDIEGSRVLDIGAGLSNNSAYFSKAKYVSQDIVQNRYNTIDYVFDICKESGAINDESIDVILCSQVLEHLTDPNNALKEMYRVLKPGGKVFLTTHMAFEEHMLPYDYWRFTENGMRLLAKQSKFKVNHLKRHGATMNLIHFAFWTWPIRVFFKDRSGFGYYLYSLLSTPFVLITGIFSELLDYISKENGIYTNFEIVLE